MKTIEAYQCDYCKKYSKSKSVMKKHESKCFHNPKKKTCATCGNHYQELYKVENQISPFNHDGGVFSYKSICKAGINIYELKDGKITIRLCDNCEYWIENEEEEMDVKEKSTQSIRRIEISIYHETESRDDGKAKELLSVSRSITSDGKEVYKDKMSPKMYIASKDPIRNLECFLLGLKEPENSNNISCDSRKGGGFFAQIWRKLFCKKIQFIT